MASRNEYRAAASRVRLSSRPAVSVPPERDTPGTSAMAWAKPITTPSRIRKFSSVRVCRPQYSANASTNANTISVVATTHRLRPAVWIWSLKRNPNSPIGIEPTMTYQPIR